MRSSGFWLALVRSWWLNGTLRNKWFANDDGTTDPDLRLTGPGWEECERFWDGDDKAFKRPYVQAILRRRRGTRSDRK